MKLTYLFLIAFSILILTSCSVSSSSDNLNLKMQDVLGSWKLSKESSRIIKKEKQKAENKVITSFHLNADSTATVSFGDSIEKKLDGTWVWKAEKKIGNNSFGFSLKTDVVIYTAGHILGMQLNETDGKVNLTVGDYLFVKQ